jgi:hypothetical protein
VLEIVISLINQISCRCGNANKPSSKTTNAVLQRVIRSPLAFMFLEAKAYIHFSLQFDIGEETT